jgi:hypothetical protein
MLGKEDPIADKLIWEISRYLSPKIFLLSGLHEYWQETKENL